MAPHIASKLLSLEVRGPDQNVQKCENMSEKSSFLPAATELQISAAAAVTAAAAAAENLDKYSDRP